MQRLWMKLTRFLAKWSTSNLDEVEIKQKAERISALYYPVFAGVNTLEETESMTRDQLDLANALANLKSEWISVAIQNGVANAFSDDKKK